MLTAQFSNHMQQWIDTLQAKFYLRGELGDKLDEKQPIPTEMIVADDGLLPAIARRADQLCLLCFGYGIGISYDEANPSLLGVRVMFDDITPALLRYMTMADVIIDLLESHENPEKINLDELLYD